MQVCERSRTSDSKKGNNNISLERTILLLNLRLTAFKWTEWERERREKLMHMEIKYHTIIYIVAKWVLVCLLHTLTHQIESMLIERVCVCEYLASSFVFALSFPISQNLSPIRSVSLFDYMLPFFNVQYITKHNTLCAVSNMYTHARTHHQLCISSLTMSNRALALWKSMYLCA